MLLPTVHDNIVNNIIHGKYGPNEAGQIARDLVHIIKTEYTQQNYPPAHAYTTGELILPQEAECYA